MGLELGFPKLVPLSMNMNDLPHSQSASKVGMIQLVLWPLWGAVLLEPQRIKGQGKEHQGIKVAV